MEKYPVMVVLELICIDALESQLLNFLEFCKPVESTAKSQLLVSQPSAWQSKAQHRRGNGASTASCYASAHHCRYLKIKGQHQVCILPPGSEIASL